MDTVTTLPRGPLRVEDLEALPDDGHRYELVDGTLIVSPGPVVRHQMVVSRLLRVLADACPSEFEVLVAPLDVVLAEDTVVQPDVVVARRTDLVGAKLTALPVLAVEVLSPSTRLVDLNLKLARYERAGVPVYWVIDPDELSLRAWELREGAYMKTAFVSRDETWAASVPYAVSLRPDQLADGPLNLS